MKVKKAIIPVAGWGTRRLPITKTIEKAMLPIGNRPLVDYVVEDCVKAGINEIYIVVDEKPFSQVKDYYTNNEKLNNYLIAHGKENRLSLADTSREGVTIHFFSQKNVDEKYGNAMPVAQVVEEFDINEPVAVLMGDDFSYNADGSSDLQRLTEIVEDETESAMLATEIPHEDVEKYGVLKVDNGMLSGIYEKPKKEAETALISYDEKIETLRKLKQLVDEGILSQEEFDAKKKEILDL